MSRKPPATFELAIEILEANLTLAETEESWDAIAKSITHVSEFCGKNELPLPAELASTLRNGSRSLTSAMTSERTRLSGAAVDFISAVALQMGGQFEALLPLFFPTLLNLCSRTNKVTITRARACILAIIEATQLPSILPYLLQSVKDKSASLRLISVEGTLSCLNCFNPPDLERDARAKDIEGIIRSSARDANADVRKVSRKVFEAYKLLLPGRVDSFTAPLTPTARKYLDIKSNPNSSRPASALESLLSSTSSQQTSASNRPPRDPHTRSISSSVQSSVTLNPNLQLTKSQTIGTKKPGTRHEMGPPDYIPVRVTEPSTTTSLSRSTSAIDERKRVASSIAHPSKRTGPVASGRSVGHSITTVAVHSQPVRPVPVPIVAASAAPPSGPRRVPVEAMPPKDIEKPKEIRPNPLKVVSKEPSVLTQKVGTSGLNPTKSVVTKTVDKPNLNSKVGAKNSNKPPVAKPEPTRSQDITRPTASQLARAKPPLGVQREVAAQKPVWGRLPRKAKPQPTIQQVPTSKSTATQKRPITPAAIPLPTSPTLSVHEIDTISSDHTSPPPDSDEIVGRNSPLGEINSMIEAPDTKTPEIVEGNASAEGIDPMVEALDLGENDASTAADAPDPNLPTVEVTPGILINVGDDSPTPSDNDKIMHDPRTPSSNHLTTEVVNIGSSSKTPISALLNSIQRGFLFTPSSPISPPDTYLSRAPSNNMPFSLNTRLFGDSTQA